VFFSALKREGPRQNCNLLPVFCPTREGEMTNPFLVVISQTERGGRAQRPRPSLCGEGGTDGPAEEL